MNPTPPEVLFTWAWYGHGRSTPPPLPPLQPANVAAWVLREGGGTVASWDPTFQPGYGSFEVTISRLRPRIAWIHTHPATAADALRMVAVARRSGAAVIVGGIDAVMQPDRYLREGADAVVGGEGAVATLALVLALRASHYRASPQVIGHIPGIHSLDAGGACRASPAPESPVPAGEIPRPFFDPIQLRIHLERHREHSRIRVFPVQSASGCPAPCRSCTHSRLGRAYRRRPPEAVASEMEGLASTYDVERFLFQDELFAWDTSWLADFARARGSGAVPFEASARPGVLDERAARKLREAGATRIALDAGPGSSALAKRLDWPWSPPDAYRAAALLTEQGLELILRVVVGLPGETRADRDAVCRMIEAIGPSAVEVGRADAAEDDPDPRDWDRCWAEPESKVDPREISRMTEELRAWTPPEASKGWREQVMRTLPASLRRRLG